MTDLKADRYFEYSKSGSLNELDRILQENSVILDARAVLRYATDFLNKISDNEKQKIVFNEYYFKQRSIFDIADRYNEYFVTPGKAMYTKTIVTKKFINYIRIRSRS